MKAAKKTTTVKSYLAAVPEPARTTLEKVREAVRAAAPEAEEYISYQIPTFRLGRPLIAYAAFKRHCSIFPMSHAVMTDPAFAKYAAAKGTMRFPLDKPPPATLIKKIVKARLAENAAREKARKKK